MHCTRERGRRTQYNTETNTNTDTHHSMYGDLCGVGWELARGSRNGSRPSFYCNCHLIAPHTDGWRESQVCICIQVKCLGVHCKYTCIIGSVRVWFKCCRTQNLCIGCTLYNVHKCCRRRQTLNDRKQLLTQIGHKCVVIMCQPAHSKCSDKH